jgi:hypothetical protein
VHRITAYSKKALWDAVEAWFEGGPAASGRIKPSEAVVHDIPGRGWSSWEIYGYSTPDKEKVPIEWSSFATPFAPDPSTFGYRWNSNVVTKTDTKDGPLMTLPEYYHLVRNDDGKAKWIPVQAKDVPAETGLAEVSFSPPRETSKPYVTPDDKDSCWKKPGPVAGPFKAYPGDGSVVTYYWYRFADQPSMLNADLTDKEREEVQKRVEKIHKNWKMDQEYLPAPKAGKLAAIDPALIVKPPSGLEIGYVPIVTRQEAHE